MKQLNHKIVNETTYAKQIKYNGQYCTTCVDNNVQIFINWTASEQQAILDWDFAHKNI